MKARLIIITFFLFLLIPSITLLTTEQTKVYLSNKLLQGKAFKEAPENTRLKMGVKLLRKVYSLYVPVLSKLNISPNKNALIAGADGWLALTEEVEKVLGRRKFSTRTNHIIKTINNPNLKIFHLPTPSKFVIYQDKYNIRSKKLTVKEMFGSNLKNVTFIDTTQELIEARKIADTYSKLDTHWTDFGGYIVWQKLAKIINTTFPEFDPYGIDMLEKVENINANPGQGAWYGLYKNDWSVPVLKSPPPEYYFTSEVKFPVQKDKKIRTSFSDLTHLIRDKKHKLKTFNPNVSNNLKILIISDSQISALSPFIYGSFKETTLIHRDVVSDINKEIEVNKPDMVLFVHWGI
jgi:hypothetical protein